MDFDADVDGTISYGSSGIVSRGRIRFDITNAIPAGSSATFNFDFNELMISGPKVGWNGSGSSVARSAGMFYIDSTSLDVEVDITMTGG